jgi:selenide,water dikinase
MGPEALAQVLRPLQDMFPPADHPAVIRGLDNPDDAAVYRLDDDKAVLLTADFFPPVVDDPYWFGAIAAANALSDLYAMGARPLFAINLVGFPDDLDNRILTEILRGGAEKIREAGSVVVGGHTTVDKEPKYGLAVAGLIAPDRVLSKGGARKGDLLLLTKPLGTGLVTTAHKRQEVDEEDLHAAVASMARLNRKAAELFAAAGDAVHALTDITGFGLAGHAHEMAEQSGLGFAMEVRALPILDGVTRYSREMMVPGGLNRNADYYGSFVDGIKLEGLSRHIVYDPQTSGGLLAAVDPDQAEVLLAGFREAEEPCWVIGSALEAKAGSLVFR